MSDPAIDFSQLDRAVGSSGSEGSGSRGRRSRSGSGPVGSSSGTDADDTGRDGGGSIGDGDNGTGTGDGEPVKRRKRRTKQEIRELVGETDNPTLTPKRGRGRKSGPDLGTLIDTTVVGLFGLVATATAHEHWLKEREDVMQITGPLKAWVDQLPAKTLKKVEDRLAPTLFVVGLATVVGPDLIAEVKLRAQDNSYRRAIRAAQQAGQGVQFDPNAGSVAQGIVGPNGASRSSAGGWANSIPASASIDTSYDQ